MQHLIQTLGDQDALGPVQKGVGIGLRDGRNHWLIKVPGDSK